MILDVLIPSLDCRAEKYNALLEELTRQVVAYGLESVVMIRALIDDGSAPLGAKRNQLMLAGESDFIVYVDDDDSVSPVYLPSLVEQIIGAPEIDCVTFHAERRVDDNLGSTQRLIFDVAQNQNQVIPSDVMLMQVNHLCAIRRSKAILARHAEDLVYGSDQVFWKSLHLAGLLKTQIHIPHVLYIYNYQSENDGVSHKQEVILQSHRQMGPGWQRTVYQRKSNGFLLAKPAAGHVPMGYTELGTIRLG